MIIPELKDFSEAALDAAFAEVRAKATSAVAESDFNVEQFRLEWLGRKQGHLKSISDAWLKAAPTEAKKSIGQRFNALKESIETTLSVENLLHDGVAARVSPPLSLDVTLPAAGHGVGAEHPLVKTMAEVVQVF